MKKILTTPIKAEDLQDIRVGDVIYLTGTLVTCRDVCHRRLIELKRPIPYDLNGKAIFHAGPIVRKNGDKWEMVSVGPTTSMRMESFEREFIEQTGVKLVVGKGGMGPLTEEGCQKFKALHVIFRYNSGACRHVPLSVSAPQANTSYHLSARPAFPERPFRPPADGRRYTVRPARAWLLQMPYQLDFD